MRWDTPEVISDEQELPGEIYDDLDDLFAEMEDDCIGILMPVNQAT